MAKSKQDIINDIANHYKGTAYKDCYTGVTRILNGSSGFFFFVGLVLMIVFASINMR
jgi:hypothetical protein